MTRRILAPLAAALLFSTVAFANPLTVGAPPRGDDSAGLSLSLPTPITEVVLDAAGYCPRNPKALWCVGDSGQDGRLSMAEVQDIDVKLRAVFHEEVDQKKEEAGVYWRVSTTGDCKTYALTLAQRLHDAGEVGGAMALMMSVPDPYEAHMTLMVETSDAGMVEVGDEEGGEPHPFDLDRWVRVGFSPFDGQQLWYITVSQEEIALKFRMNHMTRNMVQPLPTKPGASPSSKK